MSEEQNKQAVTEDAEAEAKPSAEENGAPDEPSQNWDELLGEFKQATDPADNKPEPVKTDTTPEVSKELQDEVSSIRNMLFTQELSGVVNRMKGDLSVSDKMVEGFIHAEARANPAINEHFAQKHQNPEQWAKIEAKLTKDFHKEFAQLPDKNLTEDRDAVTAAVTGTTDKAPEAPPPDLSGMSDAELREFSKKNYGFTPQI